MSFTISWRWSRSFQVPSWSNCTSLHLPSDCYWSKFRSFPLRIWSILSRCVLLFSTLLPYFLATCFPFSFLSTLYWFSRSSPPDQRTSSPCRPKSGWSYLFPSLSARSDLGWPHSEFLCSSISLLKWCYWCWSSPPATCSQPCTYYFPWAAGRSARSSSWSTPRPQAHTSQTCSLTCYTWSSSTAPSFIANDSCFWLASTFPRNFGSLSPSVWSSTLFSSIASTRGTSAFLRAIWCGSGIRRSRSLFTWT